MFRQFIVIAFLLSGVVFGQGQVGTRPSSGGNTYNITNTPDDSTLENKAGGKIGIKEEGVEGWTLSPSAKDTINAFIEDSISTENDTTALKLNDAPEGHLCYLKQLSSANANGGGWFVAADSAYAENAYTRGYVYPHSTAAMQWIREEFRRNQYVYRGRCPVDEAVGREPRTDE